MILTIARCLLWGKFPSALLEPYAQAERCGHLRGPCLPGAPFADRKSPGPFLTGSPKRHAGFLEVVRGPLGVVYTCSCWAVSFYKVAAFEELQIRCSGIVTFKGKVRSDQKQITYPLSPSCNPRFLLFFWKGRAGRRLGSQKA